MNNQPNNSVPQAAIGSITSSKSPRKNRRKYLASLIAVTLLTGALIFVAAAMSRDADLEYSPAVDAARMLPVATLTARQEQSYPVRRKYTGTIVARRKSPLGFEMAGKLVRLNVEEGDAVRIGMPLAVLDTEQLDTKRIELLAQRSHAQSVLDELIAGPRREVIDAGRSVIESLAAQVKLLTIELDRHKELVQTSAVSVSEYDTVRFNLQSRQAELQVQQHRLTELLNGTRREQVDAQRANVAQLTAAIRQIDVQLKKSTMLAPFNGTISQRLVDEGTVISAGQPVFRLVEDEQLQAWIGLPVDIASRFARDEVRQIEVGGKYFPATVENLFPEIDPATQTRMVVFALDSAQSRQLVDGQFVRVVVEEVVDETGFWLPLTALQKDARGLWTCFVLSRSGEQVWQVKRRYLEILHTEQDRAFVRGTLYDHEQVIESGGHRVVAGQFVRPVTETVTASH